MGAWLSRIAVYVCLEAYRKEKTRLKHQEEFGNFTESDSEFNSVLDFLSLEELVKKIQNLPTCYRTVFNLYAIEGYTHVEISEMLGIPVGTSKGQFSRARDLLRKAIEEDKKLEKLNYATK